jgi:hypothetical protein
VRRIVFVIDQRQDFFLSLAWAKLLRTESTSDHLTVAVLVHGEVLAEFTPYLAGFDRVEVLTAPAYARSARHVPGLLRLARRYVREVRALGLSERDTVVAASFREFVLNVFVGAVKARPRLVVVRQCNHSGAEGLTRRRRLLSLHWNAWNRVFGYSPMRYRWLPASNRIGFGEYVHNPWNEEFCLTTVDRAEPSAHRIAWPFPVLRSDEQQPRAKPKRTLVFLGERYPLDETLPLERFVPVLQQALHDIRASFPDYRLVFKPRERIAIDIDLDGWEIVGAELSLESLLLDDPSIDKVVSFKSSGSYIAATYGCDGYLLYPMLELNPSYRDVLDRYFAEYRDSVVFADRIELLRESAPAQRPSAGQVTAAARPLLDYLMRAGT